MQKAKSKFKIFSKRNLLKLIVLLLFLFSVIKTGMTIASTNPFEITNAEIASKSTTVWVDSFNFEKNKVISNVIFHKVGDSITYKITIKNNEETNYTIKSISDDNQNKYISYVYDNYEGITLNSKEETTLEITEKYVEENSNISDRNQNFSVNISFTLEDESGNVTETTIPVNKSPNPQTGDMLPIYITASFVSFIILMILSTKDIYSGKHTKKRFKLLSLLVAGTLILPTISKAATETILELEFTSNIVLNNKLNFSYIIDDKIYEKTINYNEKVSDLSNPELPGYVFEGWQNEDGSDFDKETPITKDIKILAKFKPITYTITYNLNGGTVENPTTYTIETSDITLTNPTKEGYLFAGWIGTELTDKTEYVTIQKGSIENREYTATWSPLDYTIEYQGLTNEEKTAINNPTIYNIESPDIVLINPEDRTDNDGDVTEQFVGWKENVSTSINMSIPTGTMGNKTFEAVWQTANPNIYTIIYTLNGGELSEENKTAFTKFSETFTLNNPSKRGYSFDGWTGSNGDTPQTLVEIPQGTRENLNYTANWTENIYTITYHLDNGTETENPSTYTVNSDDITLNEPVKTGYTFTGWTGTDLSEKSMEVTINHNSMGNKEYTANYEANTYTVIFDKNLGTGSMENQEMTYDVNYNLNTNTFTKIGYTFIGWNSQPDGSGTPYNDEDSVINLAANGEFTLYAQWQLNENSIAEVDGTVYASLQAAIDSVPANNTAKTVHLLTNTSENITIAKNKNIVFDFENFTLKNKDDNVLIKNNGTIKISNGIIETSSVSGGAINNNSTGNLTIDGGKINVVDENGRQAVYNNGGVANISGTALLTSISPIRATVQNLSGGTLNITGGTIIQNGSQNQPGVSNAGKLNIGVKDETVNRDSPIIQGINYGVNSSSNVNFYDGTIKGTINAFNDENKVIDKETGNSIVHSQEVIDGIDYDIAYLAIGRTVTFNPNDDAFSETTKQIEYQTSVGTLPVLEKSGYFFDGWFTSAEGGDQMEDNFIVENDITLYAHWTEKFVAEIDGTKYKTLNNAVNAVPVGNDTVTIKLLLDTDETFTIPANTTIIFDLQNHCINTPNNNAVITNNGTISLLNGTIKSNSNTTAAINNNPSGKLSIINTSIISYGERQAVYNKGGFTEISGNSYLSSKSIDKLDDYTLARATIQNIDNGTLVITGGTVVSEYQDAIANESKLIIGTNDGDIDISSPVIIGNDYGVKNIGTFKFYDGTIKGLAESIHGDITEIEQNSRKEENTEIIDDLAYKTAYLVIDE